MDAELNPAQRLHALGQSLWLDSIDRSCCAPGRWHVTCVTWRKGGEAYATRPEAKWMKGHLN